MTTLEREGERSVIYIGGNVVYQGSKSNGIILVEYEAGQVNHGGIVLNVYANGIRYYAEKVRCTAVDSVLHGQLDFFFVDQCGISQVAEVSDPSLGDRHIMQ